MKTPLAAVLIATGLVSVAVVLEARPPQKPPDLTKLTTEELVGRFQQVSAQSIGSNALATATGFVALDKPLGFGSGILGTPQPEINPAMRELVRRGVTVVPALLDHLSDARRTKLILRQHSRYFGGTWFGDEYEPREEQTPNFPKGLNRAGKSFTENSDAALSGIQLVEDHDEDGYHVKVGDLCFVTLGQIVNRQLAAARYQPTECLVLSSPVRNPALAAAVRADWNGLTDADYKAFLIRDVIDPKEGSALGALLRLLYYYPDDGRVLALQLLNCPLRADSAISELVEKLGKANEQAQDKLLAEFQTTYGDAQYQAVVDELIADSQTEPLDLSKSHNAESEEINNAIATASKLVARRFTAADRHFPATKAVAWCGFQQSLVEMLADFRSELIDQAVRDLLKRSLDFQATDVSTKYEQCALAATCARWFIPAVRRGRFDRASNRVLFRVPFGNQDETIKQAYLRKCAAFLRTLAGDPALSRSASNPSTPRR